MIAASTASEVTSTLPSNAVRQHFATLNARADPLDAALLALLPTELADRRLRALRSTAFLTVHGVARWIDICATIAARRSSPQALSIIDVGCGGGRVGRYLAELVQGEVVGIDMAASALRLSHHKSEWAARVVCADAIQLPFAATSFDIALAIDCLHLCANLFAVLAEIRRTLVPGGVLIGSAYRVADSMGKERTRRSWTATFSRAGFAIDDWNDVTPEWKRVMTLKHQRRWEERQRLVARFGAPAVAACLVSERMLGEDGKPGFIETNSRWEFVASKC